MSSRFESLVPSGPGCTVSFHVSASLLLKRSISPPSPVCQEDRAPSRLEVPSVTGVLVCGLLLLKSPLRAKMFFSTSLALCVARQILA